jgi:hypothetical protein
VKESEDEQPQEGGSGEEERQGDEEEEMPSTLCCQCLTRAPLKAWFSCGIFWRKTELTAPHSSLGTYHVFEWYDVVLGVLGVLLYVANICTDLWLAFTYLTSGQEDYGGLTLTFVLLAYVVNSVMSAVKLWHYRHRSVVLWLVMMLAVVLNLGPVVM